MKIAITGHTSGIGKSIYEYFSSEHTVSGFSRSNGYNISKEQDRNRIIQQSFDADIFVNNAYQNHDKSQLELLKSITREWQNTKKLIINISSRYTNDKNLYSCNKKELDSFCEQHFYGSLHILNIKPGMVDTSRVKDIPSSSRLTTADVVTIINFSLQCGNKFKIQSITFGA
jgi:NADP-dependent 3-hydroxy acid dehydrogenase YdfG